jgi:hypothetical protein
MDDAAWFRDHAERYRKLAGAFRDHPISTRLATLAEEFDGKARDLSRQRAGAIPRDPRSRPDTRLTRAPRRGRAGVRN